MDRVYVVCDSICLIPKILFVLHLYVVCKYSFQPMYFPLSFRFSPIIIIIPSLSSKLGSTFPYPMPRVDQPSHTAGV